MYPAIQMKQTQNNSGQMVSTKGQALPLTKTTIRAIARGGMARVVVTQVFQNVHEEALSVTYQLPLPADGAVSGFSFLLQDRRVIGEVDRKNKARERYQRALSEGRSAALLEQERSSVFTQEIGNIPPKSQIEAEIIIDQKLAWMPDGCWEWRFPTVVAPKYQGEPGRSKGADKLQVEVSQEPLDERLSFSIEVRDALFGAPTSTSHTLLIEDLHDATLLSLAPNATRANQDVVVRWPVCSSTVGASLAVCRPEIGGLDHAAFGLLTLVPPAAEVEYVPRDLILLLDISGSMSGAPIQQLKEVSRALISSLQEQDQLEIIVFADSTRHWKRGATSATELEKSSAINWINRLQASGGTEMKSGIIKALAPIRRDSQRQVIVMTDGHIGFEDEIVREVFSRLPAGSRIHTLGIGSSVNRSLTSPVARAGRGVEQIVGLRESASAAAARLLERTSAPVVVGLHVGGDALIDAASARLPDLFAGSPALLSVKLRPEGGPLWIEGYAANGLFRQELYVKPMSPNHGDQMLAALYARESVEDLELGICAGEKKAEADQKIEELGVAFQIATRLTSWVAISKESTVDTELKARHEVMPQELPDGMNAAALGLRPVQAQQQRAAGQSANTGKPMMKRAKLETLKDKSVEQEKADEPEPVADGVAWEELAKSDEIESIEELTDDGDFGDAISAIDSVDAERAPEKTRAPVVTRSITTEEREKSYIGGEKTGETEDTKASPQMKRPARMPLGGTRGPGGASGESRRERPKKEKKKVAKSAPIWRGSFTGHSSLQCFGSIVQQTQSSLVIVFEIPGGLGWRLPGTVSLVSIAGVVEVQVNAAQSTSDGTVATLREVRLVLVIAKGQVAPTKISFSLAGSRVDVALA